MPFYQKDSLSLAEILLNYRRIILSDLKKSRSFYWIKTLNKQYLKLKVKHNFSAFSSISTFLPQLFSNKGMKNKEPREENFGKVKNVIWTPKCAFYWIFPKFFIEAVRELNFNRIAACCTPVLGIRKVCCPLISFL